jgi:hypothetical protein
MKAKWCLAVLLAALPVTPAVAEPADWLPWNWSGDASWLPWNWGDNDVPEGVRPPKLAMAAPDMPGFVVVHERSDRNRSIRQEVPKGETAQNWSKMITTQWFRRLSERLSPGEFTARMLEGLPGRNRIAGTGAEGVGV